MQRLIIHMLFIYLNEKNRVRLKPIGLLGNSEYPGHEELKGKVIFSLMFYLTKFYPRLASLCNFGDTLSKTKNPIKTV